MESQPAPPRVLLQTPRFDVVEMCQATRTGGVRARQVVLHPGAVVILPMVDDDQVCLIRNERVAVGKTLIELPAGTMEPPATPQEMAIRELKEETGYAAARWRQLPSFYMSPGILREQMHAFVAEGLSDEAIGPEWAAPAAPNYYFGRAISISGGTNEIQHNIVAKGVLGL